MIVGHGTEEEIQWHRQLNDNLVNQWEFNRIYLRYLLSEYDINEFKNWWLIKAIPVWGMNPILPRLDINGNQSILTRDELSKYIDPFLKSVNPSERWRDSLVDEDDYYAEGPELGEYNIHDGTGDEDLAFFDGIKSCNPIGIYFIHWMILYKKGIDVKNLDYIFEFGGGVGHVPKMVRKLGFNGNYTIYDFPEFSTIQQFYNNMNVTTMSHPNLIDMVDNKGDGLFYSTWGFCETPLEFRKKFKQVIQKCRYCCILYQHKFGDIDNEKYFTEFAYKNSDFSWVKVDFPFFWPDQLGNTYLIGKR